MMYYDLEAWKVSMDLAQKIYEITAAFPKEELFGICSQMRRAAVSIPSNIAEGSARQSAKDNVRFLRIAAGSLAELETQVVLAQRIGFLSSENAALLKEPLSRCGRLLGGLSTYAQRRLSESASK
ncbi:MAG: four helix bundle protein [Candidatus Spyradosoma sp.]